jgi:hypothetical protein
MHIEIRTKEFFMRLLALSGILLASTLTDVSASLATEGPWCLRSDSRKNGDCSIPSFEMCRITALPENGSCSPNPNYRGGVQTIHPKRTRG